MIERARQSSSDIEWRVADIQTWSEPDRFDLIFANASLHWIANHGALTRRLIETLKPAGVLAFQMPALYNQSAAQAVQDWPSLQDGNPIACRKGTRCASTSPAGTTIGWLRFQGTC